MDTILAIACVHDDVQLYASVGTVRSTYDMVRHQRDCILTGRNGGAAVAKSDRDSSPGMSPAGLHRRRQKLLARSRQLK